MPNKGAAALHHIYDASCIVALGISRTGAGLRSMRPPAQAGALLLALLAVPGGDRPAACRGGGSPAGPGTALPASCRTWMPHSPVRTDGPRTQTGTGSEQRTTFAQGVFCHATLPATCQRRVLGHRGGSESGCKGHFCAGAEEIRSGRMDGNGQPTPSPRCALGLSAGWNV